jgi:hypothetical protein
LSLRHGLDLAPTTTYILEEGRIPNNLTGQTVQKEEEEGEEEEITEQNTSAVFCSTSVWTNQSRNAEVHRDPLCMHAC